MTSRFQSLTDTQWEQIEPLPPSDSVERMTPIELETIYAANTLALAA